MNCHPRVSSIHRATHSAPSRLTRRMTQMTGAAFQSQVSLNEQTTDPTSHTPVDVHSTFSGSGCHLLKSDDRPLIWLSVVKKEKAAPTNSLSGYAAFIFQGISRGGTWLATFDHPDMRVAPLRMPWIFLQCHHVSVEMYWSLKRVSGRKRNLFCNCPHESDQFPCGGRHHSFAVFPFRH